MAALQSDLHTDELLYRLDEMLAASGQAMVVLDEQGSIVYSSQLADELLEITSDSTDNTRRRIGAKFKTLQNEPVTSFCDFKPADFPLLLLSSSDGKPERMLKVLGLHKRGTYLIQDRSEELQRGAAERELLDVAAHDLRAGLVPAKTYAQMLLTSIFGPVNDKQTEALQAIDACVQKQAEKISGLLDLVKAEENRLEVQRETASLADILKQTLTVVERDCRRRNLRVVTDLDLRVALVEADVQRLQRIFTSLMLRCMKHSTSGGAIGVELKYPQLDRARLRFWDQGTGSQAEDIEALVSPVSRMQERPSSKRHLDIELGGAYEILRQHQGRIEADTEPHTGTTYRVCLPVRQKSGTSRTTQRLPVLNAMLAHNDDAEAAILSDVLQSRGVNTVRFTSGIDAVKAAREKHFALVFLSDKLPGLDPQRALSAIRAQRSEDPQQMCLLRHDSAAGDSVQNGNDTWLGSIKSRDVAENVISEMISKLIEAP